MSPVRLFCSTYDAAIARGIPAGEATEAAANAVAAASERRGLERAAEIAAKYERRHAAPHPDQYQQGQRDAADLIGQAIRRAAGGNDNA